MTQHTLWHSESEPLCADLNMTWLRGRSWQKIKLMLTVKNKSNIHACAIVRDETPAACEWANKHKWRAKIEEQSVLTQFVRCLYISVYINILGIRTDFLQNLSLVTPLHLRIFAYLPFWLLFQICMYVCMFLPVWFTSLFFQVERWLTLWLCAIFQ